MNQADLKLLVAYDPETGSFTRLVGTGKGAHVGAVTLGAIDRSTGYRKLCVGGKRWLAHRLAWLYMTGRWPADQVDHRNEDRSDNRFCNLREADNAQNNQRTKARKDSRTGVLGVSWHKRGKKYVAQIRHHGATIYLGMYDSIAAAKTARQQAEIQYHTHHRSAS